MENLKSGQTNIKVLFVCKKRIDSYGISFGLLNSARMLCESLKYQGVEARVEAVEDANGIDRVVHHHKPTHVVIHALWATPAKMNELCQKYKTVSWNVRIHSKPPFLAMEGIASDWIAAYGSLQNDNPNLWLSANSFETDQLLRSVFQAKSLTLENTYIKPDPPETASTSQWEATSKTRIACFGAVRPLKNHYAQGAAAILYGNANCTKVEFHINGGREEQGGDRVVKNLRAMFAASGVHKLVEHPWYPHDVLVHEVLPQMDLGMQVSFSETFNIVAADMVAAGLPTIGSSDIYWMSGLFHADPNNMHDMVVKLETADMLGRFGVWLNRRGLNRSNRKAIRGWMRGLKKTSMFR